MVEYGHEDVCASPFECTVINRRGRQPMKTSWVNSISKGLCKLILKVKREKGIDEEVHVVERGNGFYGDDDNMYNNIGFVGQPPR